MARLAVLAACALATASARRLGDPGMQGWQARRERLSASRVELRRRSGPAIAMVDPSAAAAIDVQAVLSKAGRAALGGGTSGAAAAVVQVVSLMWLRTTINYQYREGGSSGDALRELWKQGGLGRLYQGLPYALIQTPLTRFGDVAANTGVPVLLDAFPATAGLAPFVRQIAPSAASALWRTTFLPLDTVKTTLQVEGETALGTLRRKVETGGPQVLWEGAYAAAATSFVGSYPWWLTYNFLQGLVPSVSGAELDPAYAKLLTLLRLASIGFGAVCVSDTVSNSLRVIKTTKQTSPTTITYTEAAQQVIERDGVAGLFTRGLGTKLVANGLQGAIFAVAWKYFEQELFGQQMK